MSAAFAVGGTVVRAPARGLHEAARADLRLHTDRDPPDELFIRATRASVARLRVDGGGVGQHAGKSHA